MSSEQLARDDGGFLVPEGLVADLKRWRRREYTQEELATIAEPDEDDEPNELWPDDEPFVPQPLTAKVESSPELTKAFSEWFLAGPMGGRLS